MITILMHWLPARLSMNLGFWVTWAHGALFAVTPVVPDHSQPWFANLPAWVMHDWIRSGFECTAQAHHHLFTCTPNEIPL